MYGKVNVKEEDLFSRFRVACLARQLLSVRASQQRAKFSDSKICEQTWTDSLDTEDFSKFLISPKFPVLQGAPSVAAGSLAHAQVTSPYFFCFTPLILVITRN